MDAIKLRSFQDNLIVGMAFIAHIIPSSAEDSPFMQKIALNDFLREGRPSYPTRYIDLICMCAVVLEQKKALGKLTEREEGFADLFTSNEAICEVYDFVMSDASWTRLFGNITAHPNVKFMELNDMISRSVHREEQDVATSCAAALKMYSPDEETNKRVEMAAILSRKKKVRALRKNKVMSARHELVVGCLNYYRKGSDESEWAWSKTPKY